MDKNAKGIKETELQLSYIKEMETERTFVEMGHDHNRVGRSG